MPLVVGGVSLGATAVLVTTLLGIAGRAPFAAAALVVAAAIVVVESIALSLARALTGPALLASQAAAGVIAAVAWWRSGTPRPPSFRPPRITALLVGARSQPPLALLVAAVVVALAWQAALALAVAPNEPDSIAYHLPRAAMWAQQHTALQYRAGVLNDPRQAHPPNGELLVAWTMGLSHSDRYAQLVQWLAMLGALAVIFSATQLIGGSRAEATFAACLFALAPVALIESATAQTDLLLSFLLAAALLFAVIGLRARRAGELIVAALATGLAAGTKLDAVLIVPAALLIVGATGWHERPPRRLIATGAASTGAALLVLGSFNYVQNELHTHTLTGWTGIPEGDFVKASPVRDAARVGWNLLDAPGLPVPDRIADGGESVVRHLFHGMQGSYFSAPHPAIRTYASADDSAYGLVGALIGLPVLLIASARPRSPPWRRVIALSAISYFLAYSLALGYNPESGRYLLPAAAVTAPLLGALARSCAIAAIVVALSLATLPGILLHESYKPVLSSPENSGSVLGLDRLAQLTLDDKYLLREIRRAERRIGPHDGLGFIYQDDLAEYYLFGEPLQRRVIGFSPAAATAAALRANRLRALFIGFANEAPCHGRLCVRDTVGLRFVRLGHYAYLATLGSGYSPGVRAPDS